MPFHEKRRTEKNMKCLILFFTAEEFKPLNVWCNNKQSTISQYITQGFTKARKSAGGGPLYVCFLVPRKGGIHETEDLKQLNLHMCGYVVRSKDGVKDGKIIISHFSAYANLVE